MKVTGVRLPIFMSSNLDIENRSPLGGCRVSGKNPKHFAFSGHLRSGTRDLSRGFTLIELLVVTGIIVVVSSVMLVNNGRFGGVVQLQNLTYDVALTIRQAQVYGISVARFGSSTFSAGYGVHFDTSSPKTYVLFADIYPLPPDQNGLYDPGQGELVATTDITRGYAIQSLCTPAGADSATCTRVTTLDMLFVRPEPDAWISGPDTSCLLQSGSCQGSARITLVAPRGDTMSVVVDASGQISVRRASE